MNATFIKLCPNCNNELEKEKRIDIDYPNVCRNCDENFYDFEILEMHENYLDHLKEKTIALLLEYSMKSRGEDDLRGMIKVFSEIIGMSYENLIDEIKWINKYEND
tara:strand:- start:425 stop:742 length:318 start_codon:yes stop_codon:yes gene_type:complete